ncbi:hypothetical protein PC116_g4493 [Phytophthora cactorum]|uniref:Uncharacterized protein n=1 Tax=Phytophthora cactorum TaxID=29920 RepID=A0A329T1B1_9STRA|nr:hypothetical protein PC113_g3400 [Phytophthora cactorum]KAG2951780.1 hypothetical protein PC117_g3306 [Phytophthora cactorum]KAG3038481.1 hypothetical protein PC119_g2855 [Phytophthora cactorum]KAG4247790.1 hypothetical protein PC116_g4493 [Phytophthora cactorum]RAW41692.1 hypothetical protein PC110_g2083 [Phytophthora cactorum]
MQHLKDAKGDKPLSEELADVLRQIEPEDECFALQLEGHYKEEDIQSRGADALSKMDKTRYRALLEANSLVPEDKALVFYIAQLSRAVQQAHKDPKWKAKYAFWQDYDRKDSVSWYSVDAFLRGPEIAMTTEGVIYFRNLKHAQRWTRHTQENASFELTAEGSGRDAFVTITKTRRLYEEQQTIVAKFKEEKEQLHTKRFKDPAGSRAAGKKRRREEDEDKDGDVTME